MVRIVLTRDSDAAAPYVRALAALGFEVSAVPVTAIEPIPAGEALLAEELREEVRADAIFVASRNAAAALVRAADGRAVHEPVYAVGEATAAVLRAGGVDARLRGAGDGASLAHAMIGELRSHARVLVPCSADRRDEPLAVFRAAGLHVEEVHVYRTVPIAFEIGAADVVVVFAPSQVRALGKIGAPHVIAIGETTAAAIGPHALVAASPTPEAVAAAVRAVYPPKS